MARRKFYLASILAIFSASLSTQTPTSAAQKSDEELRFVVYLSRHGVRSPTGKAAQYNIYSAAPWPEWDVPPGYLTAHGYQLIKLFGAYDRSQLASEGMVIPEGCGSVNQITLYADSDQRTRKTGEALAQGLLPGCNAVVHGMPEGTNDPLFHPARGQIRSTDPSLATAAIAGRIGNNSTNVSEAYRPQLAAMDKLLASCGDPSPNIAKRTSLLDVPSSLTPGKGDHLPELRGPLSAASTLAENLLLEYTQGMSREMVGWGCVGGDEVRSLIALHTAATDFTLRTPLIAKIQSSNLLDHILLSLQQAMLSRKTPGAIGRAADRALFIVGHDTNQTALAGLLNLNWIVDGRRDDTPPGGSLVFELWKNRTRGDYSVRMYFTAQTLEQMRSSTELTMSSPPVRVPVFVPGCSRSDFSCDWPAFVRTVRAAMESP